MENNPTEIQNILSDTNFQKKLARIAVQKNLSQAQANLEAETYLQELFAEHETTTNIGFIEAFQYMIGQGYDKAIDTNPQELKALAKLMRQYPIAFVLTHKSYIDLLVLSLVLARHGLPIPFVFAGINLDLFVVGKLARKNGTIFIRRSFKDNPVYKASLRHFITYLLNKQSNFMWAIEGTRSRTGKLVWPQMGILKYIMEADQDVQNKVKYVPVSIVYDLIPDVDDMTEEGRGKKKNPENLKWLINYWRKMGKGDLGKISLRIGEAVDIVATAADYKSVTSFVPIANRDEQTADNILDDSSVSRLAFDLVNKINDITPITTVSLVCMALLSKFALTKRGVESNVAGLMQLIERHKLDALVDRGTAIGESVQMALNLLAKADIIHQQGESLHTKYTINRERYLQATYYANMSVHHLYHRAFIELALLQVADSTPDNRSLVFWTEIMALRDYFKFEFFYSAKEKFTDEIEAELNFMLPDWQAVLFEQNTDVIEILKNQRILVAPVILNNYTEAYKVVGHGLQIWDSTVAFEEKKFTDYCLFLGEEMHWLGQIKRIEAVSKPFLQNGIRLVSNLKLVPDATDLKKEIIANFNSQTDDIALRTNRLQGFTLDKHSQIELNIVPVEREIVPGSKTEGITQEILSGERGAHIGAFFDLDRTLISGFSAKDFVKTRLMSGKFTSKELVGQFGGVMSYATGGGNFASMAATSAKGVAGVSEQVFIEVGEEVYQKTLAEAIFPESRALVAAHLSMGHTVAIVSAATPYQVEPVARDLGVDIVKCTRMEVEDGVFTGRIIEPACWGEGKAHAGRELAKEYGLDMFKSYFYTDSAEDLPLLEIVGNPRPINPDTKLSALAFQNDWPVLRFTEDNTSRLENLVRTGMASGIFVPAMLKGVLSGVQKMSLTEGIESMVTSLGDLGTAVAGIKLAVKGEQYLWSDRPAVFIFNHQSNADALIVVKLLRKGIRGIAKKELQKMPIIGQIMQAAGVIFLDRAADKEKSIEAMRPAIESLKNGTSVVIFPEGTRSYDYTLGKFKKGAFHIAMGAGVPVIPIILKNAHDVMPRGKNVFNPTLVEVIVLPPIHTHDWNKTNMDAKINEVRNLFLKELGQEDVTLTV
jgi:putative phosphoserine phosphatase/1-acylglycerol-3-phosphate O-acyltransferase